MQDIAFDFMDGDVVPEASDALYAYNLVCVNVGFCRGGQACSRVAWQFKVGQSKLVLEKFLTTVNR